ncbi:SHOCT-like domain-containing protein [Desnuesiella massiliensis]|uniref:SHOCT-like domain-containing protein n=1 Tax=Desnuesiella massiliensis TaxID=1650662 RepID=UPI0006E43406|nr:hypothetical protein [Desnuesiella massiliensis]
MNEEIMKVLKMVEEGKIDANKAAEIIEVLKKNEETVLSDGTGGFIQEITAIEPIEPIEPEPPVKPMGGRMLIIKVDSPKDKVNVRLPINFIKGVLGACKKLPVNVEGMENVDIELIIKAIDEGLVGKIVDVQASGGEIVEISII